jgi:tetratricopeptide (TPR) repeat protein
LTLLDRALAIARAGAARLPGANRSAEADAQRLRAVALLGLNNAPLALTAAREAGQLAPVDPLPYHLSSSALLQLGRADEAVMTLLTGSIVSGDRGLSQEAAALYANGVDSEGCAVSGGAGGAVLNPRCPIVQRHSCEASAAAYQILRKVGQNDRAAQTRATAIAALGCSAELMERPSSLVP